MDSTPNYKLDRFEYRLAMNEYQMIYISCFLPVTESRPSTFGFWDPRKHDTRKKYEAQLNNKSITSIKAGVWWKDIDPMRECGIRYSSCKAQSNYISKLCVWTNIDRLQTGLHVPKDSSAAVRIFLSVATGPYPRSKRAIAYSLATHSCKMQVMGDEEGLEENDINMLTPSIYAEKSTQLGLFSFTCFYMAQLYDGLDLRLKEPFKQLKGLWSSYEDYRFVTGFSQQSICLSRSVWEQTYRRSTIVLSQWP